MDLPTRLDLQAIGRDYMVQRGKRVDPVMVDTLGTDANIFVGSSAQVAYALVIQLAFAVARLLLDGAEKEDLDRYAWDRYQLTRKGASPALVDLRIYRTTGGTAGDINAGTKFKTLAGLEYISLETASFQTGTTFRVVTARAIQAGKASQTGANTIRAFESTPFDSALKVNNDDRSAGGEDAEEDGVFRERIRAFWRTARRGILAAIEFGALQVAGVVSAQAIEAIDGGARPARVVNLYIADSSGVANAALARAVDVQLLEYRAGGIQVISFPSMPTMVQVVLALTFSANTDTRSLGEVIRSAIVEYVNSLPVNGTLRRGALQAVLERYRGDGLIPSEQSLVSPTGDLVPSPGQSLRATMNDVILE